MNGIEILEAQNQIFSQYYMYIDRSLIRDIIKDFEDIRTDTILNNIAMKFCNRYWPLMLESNKKVHEFFRNLKRNSKGIYFLEVWNKYVN